MVYTVVQFTQSFSALFGIVVLLYHVVLAFYVNFFVIIIAFFFHSHAVKHMNIWAT